MEYLNQNLYSTSGKKVSTIKLSEEVFGNKLREDLVHQVLTSMMSNLRAGTAHTKDRGEVSGGGKKPWKQKGTGRARHASSRSPIWVGGGIAHGPRSDKDYSKKINSKMRFGALASILSEKVRLGKVLFVEPLASVTGKTKDAENVVAAFKTIEGFATLDTRKNENNMLLIVPAVTAEILNSFKNLPYVKITSARNLSALSAAKARYIVVADAAGTSEILLGRYNNLMGALVATEA